MHSTKYGGLEHYFSYMAKKAAENGWLSIYQYKSNPDSSKYTNDLKKIGSKVVTLDMSGGRFKTACDIIKLLILTRPKLIMLHFQGGNDHLPMVLPFLAKILGITRVYRMIHMDYMPILSHRQKEIFKMYTKIIGVSKAATKSFLSSGYSGGNCCTHYLGVMGNRNKSAMLRKQFRSYFKIPSSSIVLGTLVFDSHIKGVDLLLEAFKEVCDKNSNIHLLIIGINPEESKLPELAKNIGVEKNIHWAGIQDDGWKLLNIVDVYIQPSRREAIGLAIMEAIALELPVVAYNVGGIPEIVEDMVTGILVEPENPSALAKAIVKLIENPDLMKEFGKKGRAKYISSFDGVSSVKNLLDILEIQ